MTRAEYESKYGVPAPVKQTPQPTQQPKKQGFGSKLAYGMAQPFVKLGLSAAESLGNLGVTGGLGERGKILKKQFESKGYDVSADSVKESLGAAGEGFLNVFGGEAVGKAGFQTLRNVAQGLVPLKSAIKPLSVSGGLLYGAQGLATGVQEDLSGVQLAKRVGTNIVAGSIANPLLQVGVPSLFNKTQQQLRRELGEFTTKALAPRGAKTAGQLASDTQKKTAGIQLLQKNAPKLTVIDADGVEKAFDPAKATFAETAYAVGDMKNKIFRQMQSQLETAGQQGIQVDLKPTLELLQTQANEGLDRETRKQAQNLLEDIAEFQQIHGNDPAKLHDFIQLKNKKLEASYRSGTIDAVTKDAMESLRTALDDVVERGPYGQQYGAMKSIEKDITREAQRLARQKGSGLEGYADMFGNIDLLMSFITQNPAQAARGLATKGFFNLLRRSKDPERMLQKAFTTAGKIQSGKGVVGQTYDILGDTGGFGKAVQDYADDPQIGLSIRNVNAKLDKLRPDKLAKEINDEDAGIINDYLENPQSLKAFERAQPMFRSLGIDMANEEMKDRFLREVLAEYRETPGSRKLAGISEKPVKKEVARTTKPIRGDAGKFTGSESTKPYKETGPLTTKLLKALEGRTTVSKQFLMDATNRPELKESERKLFRELLQFEGDKINVSQFAKKVKAELLPLKVKNEPIKPTQAKSELKKLGITLKREMDGGAYPVDKDGNFLEYDELPTSTQRLLDQVVGSAETYSDIRGARYENISLPDELRGNVKNYKENIYESPIKTSAGGTHFYGQTDNYFGHTRIEDMSDNKTRRVIEVQSDLYQKGNLEREGRVTINNERGDLMERLTQNPKDKDAFTKLKAMEANDILRKKEISKLEQYNDPTAHFRMVREEIKKAAQDGKTKLQFPTGETAMKIEGLGINRGDWVDQATRRVANLDNLKIGQTLSYPNINGQDWIITEVLGEGKFKAVPKDNIDFVEEQLVEMGFPSPDDAIEAITKGDKRVIELLEDGQGSETFDISGKVDTNNPIYKFYEKDVQQYLKKFNGKRITDKNGVEWIEVPIEKEMARMPVEAFGLLPLLGVYKLKNKDKYESK